MNATVQIAQHLNISPNQIKRCEKWAKVYFVIVIGRRPTFVSKKVVAIAMIYTPLEAYNKALELECNIREDWWTPTNLQPHKIIIRRPTEAQLKELEKVGFVDGVFTVRELEEKKLSLAEEYAKEVEWCKQYDSHVSYEFAKQCKDAGYDVSILGYAHI